MSPTSAPAGGLQPDELFGHPRGLYVCFATELWERFSFYGMKYLLLLYLTKYHLFSDLAGYDVLGAYAGLVYGLPVIGGLIADRYLGTRKAVVFGALLLCLGHLLMAFEGDAAVRYEAGTVLAEAVEVSGVSYAAGVALTADLVVQDVVALDVLFLALALITVGVGFLKPNISTMVGQLYAIEDPRRDAGFTIFYMGINIGAFVAILLCGWLGESFGWGYGFGAAGIGMLLGLVVFLRGQRHLMGLAEPPDEHALQQRRFGLKTELWIYLGGLLALIPVWILVQHEPVVHTGLNTLMIVALAGLPLYALITGSKEEFQRTLVLMALISFSIIFWALFEQSAGSMTLYADRIVDRELMGTEVRASMFGSLNPLFIITLAPLFAWLWVRLSARGLEPSVPVKFAIGIVLAGAGFGALVLGASGANADAQVNMGWLVAAYFLHTSGELCLSPVGLSAVTKLSLKRVVGVSMGTWFLATSLSETVATRIGKLAALDSGSGTLDDPVQMLQTYTALYEFLAIGGVAAGVVLLVLSPLLKRGMHGVR